jgi:hypothetical protein
MQAPKYVVDNFDANYLLISYELLIFFNFLGITIVTSKA